MKIKSFFVVSLLSIVLLIFGFNFSKVISTGCTYDADCDKGWECVGNKCRKLRGFTDLTATIEPTAEPTATPTATPEATPDVTATPEATPDATATPEATPDATATPSPTPCSICECLSDEDTLYGRLFPSTLEFRKALDRDIRLIQARKKGRLLNSVSVVARGGAITLELEANKPFFEKASREYTRVAKSRKDKAQVPSSTIRLRCGTRCMTDADCTCRVNGVNVQSPCEKCIVVNGDYKVCRTDTAVCNDCQECKCIESEGGGVCKNKSCATCSEDDQCQAPKTCVIKSGCGTGTSNDGCFCAQTCDNNGNCTPPKICCLWAGVKQCRECCSNADCGECGTCQNNTCISKGDAWCATNKGKAKCCPVTNGGITTFQCANDCNGICQYDPGAGACNNATCTGAGETCKFTGTNSCGCKKDCGATAPACDGGCAENDKSCFKQNDGTCQCFKACSTLVPADSCINGGCPVFLGTNIAQVCREAGGICQCKPGCTSLKHSQGCGNGYCPDAGKNCEVNSILPNPAPDTGCTCK